MTKTIRPKAAVHLSKEVANLHGVKAPEKHMPTNLGVSFSEMMGGDPDDQADVPAGSPSAEPVDGRASASAALHTEGAASGILAEIDVSLVDGDRFQPRRKVGQEELQQLALSILSNGGLNNPVIVRPTCEGRYEIIAGHRRFQAVRDVLGEPKVLVRIRELSDQEAEVLAGMDNHDVPITDYENGIYYKRLLDKGYFKSQAALARSMGVSESSISRGLAYAALPAEVHALLDKAPDLIGNTAAAEFARLVHEGYPDIVVDACRHLAAGKMTQDQARRWAVYGADRVHANPAAREDLKAEAAEGSFLFGPPRQSKQEEAVERLAIGGREVAKSAVKAKGKRLVLDFESAEEAAQIYAEFKRYLAQKDGAEG